MKKLVLGLMMMVFACSEDGGAGDERFVDDLVTQEQHQLLRDTETGLTWVNDIRGCFAGITDTAATNCEELNMASFGGIMTWRTPTAQELSNLFKGVVAAGIKLNYINSMCAVMTASDGYVFTENSDSPGTISTLMPGNAGLRCVTAP